MLDLNAAGSGPAGLFLQKKKGKKGTKGERGKKSKSWDVRSEESSVRRSSGSVRAVGIVCLFFCYIVYM